MLPSCSATSLKASCSQPSARPCLLFSFRLLNCYYVFMPVVHTSVATNNNVAIYNNFFLPLVVAAAVYCRHILVHSRQVARCAPIFIRWLPALNCATPSSHAKSQQNSMNGVIFEPRASPKWPDHATPTTSRHIRHYFICSCACYCCCSCSWCWRCGAICATL